MALSPPRCFAPALLVVARCPLPVARCPLHGAWRGPRAAATKCRSMCPPHSRDSIGVRTAIVLGSLDAASRSDQQLAGCASQRTTRNVNHRACTHDQQARGNVPCNAQHAKHRSATRDGDPSPSSVQASAAIRGRRAAHRAVLCHTRARLLAKLWAHRTAPHCQIASWLPCRAGYRAAPLQSPGSARDGCCSGSIECAARAAGELTAHGSIGERKKGAAADPRRCCTLHGARCMLQARALHVVRCMSHAVRCTPRVARCVACAACCIQRAASPRVVVVAHLYG